MYALYIPAASYFRDAAYAAAHERSAAAARPGAIAEPLLLHECLDQTHRFATPEQWGVVRRSIPQAWIDQALAATGTATVRRRRLPLEKAVWLVLGIALLRDRPILDTAQALDLALPSGSGDTVRHFINSSALSQARQRLGAEPLQWLFQHTAARRARPQAGRQRWRGLSLYALDGMVWRTCDTPTNRECFGGQRNHAGLWPLQHRQQRHWLIPARKGFKGEVPPRRSERRFPCAARMSETRYPVMKNAAQR